MDGLLVLQVFLNVLGFSTRGVWSQISTAKVMRSNVRRDDLYRKEEVVMVTAVGGAIHSPRFPSSYPRNLLLSWKMLSPPATRIRLEFDERFGLEEPDNGVCRYDFVEVEDQSESSTIIWGRWCGGKAPPRLTSKNNTLRVTFKSDDYFVAKPGFKVLYSLMYDSAPSSSSNTNWEAVTLPVSESVKGLVPALQDSSRGLLFDDVLKGQNPAVVTVVPFTAEDLDQTIAAFDTVEQLLKNLNPDTWRQDLDSIYTQTHIVYRSRTYNLASRQNKVDLDRLYDDVKRYSCTPRNYSVNLREELRTTSAVFFPRCLLVQRCGGNCGCGTENWNNGCYCQASKTSIKLHEVLKYAPPMSFYHRQKPRRTRWLMDEIFLTHHERCECVCPSRAPR